MKENGKTIDEQKPSKWEIWATRFRDLSFVVLGLGVVFGGLVFAGGTGVIVGEGFRRSESGLRQASKELQEEEKKK